MATTDPATTPSSSSSTEDELARTEGHLAAPEPGDRSDQAETAVVVPAKPRLRGWVHAVTFPVALVASIVLVVLAPGTAAKVSTAVFGLSAILLFGTSAVYHLGTWSPKVAATLRRADHSNIFLIIAGTYTPLAVLLLPTSRATVLLVIVWSGAVLGLVARIIWLNAPRWVYVPIYLALGWVAVGYMPQFWTTPGGHTIVYLVAVGGLAYSVGAVFYALKRPNPVPGWFGFHELFHVLTVIGYGCHYAAILVAVMQLR